MAKALYITEKPSVATSFASVLGVTVSRADRSRGYAETADAIITWCFGHLVTMAYPDAYNPAWKQWRLQHLPILPKQWIYQTIQEKGNQQQYEVIAGLLHRTDVDMVYACTDSGREGEYIFRLVYTQSGSQKPARRVWISAQTEEAVKRGIEEAKELAAYDNLGKSAYCRAKEDWLFGMNFSRLFTCRYGRDLGRHLKEQKSAVIAIGRVMTCVLGLVVERELEIRHFVPRTNYAVVASFVSQQGGIAYKGRWQPPKKTPGKTGKEGKTGDTVKTDKDGTAEAAEEVSDALTREDAQALIDRLTGKRARCARWM